jgi:hypothetical protein
VQQAAVTSDSVQLVPEHMSLPVSDPPLQRELPRTTAGFHVARAEAVEAFERAYVEETAGGKPW